MSDKDTTPETIVRQFELDLSLPEGFFQDLLHEDDWSFVIKLHALTEAAVTHVITQELGRQELADIITSLSTSNDRNGKIAFARALGCLSDADIRFIRELSGIRNRFAHDVRHAGKTLAQHVSSMSAHQFAQFQSAFGPGDGPVLLAGRSVSATDFVRHNPKLSIWIAGMYVLASAYQQKELSALARERAEKQQSHAVAILELFNQLSVLLDPTSPQDVVEDVGNLEKVER